MVSASDRVSIQGKPIDRLTLERYKSFNQLVKSPKFGGERSDITVVQAIGGAAASAGTHKAPGGSLDLTAFNYKNRNLADRLFGGAGWYRPTLKGVWSAHYHTVTAGVGYAPALARAQVTAMYGGRNGLANNGRDTGPRLKVWPLFVAPWTERGKRGTYYTKKGVTGRSQGTDAATSTGAIPKGAKFTVIGIVNAGGVLWAINTNGVHVRKSDLLTSKPSTSTPSLPTQKKALTLTIFDVNVIANRLGSDPKKGRSPFKVGKDYDDRVFGFEKMRDIARASEVATTESGTYKNGEGLSKAFGWGGFRATADGVPMSAASFTLHGDDAGDITQGVHHDPKKRELLKEGKYTTGDARESAYHNTATWTLKRDRLGTDVLYMTVAHHADYRTRGKTSASTADKVREKHAKMLISKAEALAAGFAKEYGVKSIPIIFIGDFNQDKDDFYDGPGRAMAAAGYVDAQVVAASHSGPETTFNDFDPKKVAGYRPDRIFVKKGTVVGAMKVVPGWSATTGYNTDHNGLGVTLTLTNG